jgi:hypothetical protein
VLPSKDKKLLYQEVFKGLKEDNRAQTVVFRIVGWLMMVIGIGIMFSPIIALVSFIPLVGTMIAWGISIAVWIFAILVGTIFTLLTIAIAWIFYRPFYGLILVSVVVVIVLIMSYA